MCKMKYFKKVSNIGVSTWVRPRQLRHLNLRLLIGLSAKWDLNITHLDVITVFLNCNLQVNVYMKQPEGFVVSYRTKGMQIQ